MENTISFITKFGWVNISEIDKKISSIRFGKKPKKGRASQTLKSASINIQRYLAGKNKKIIIPLRITGNKYQLKIWQELRKIKRGSTKTYGEIAKKLKLSPRHVGRVCGQNQHLLAIPCHRVIGSNGKLVGFSAKGGVGVKKKLLDFERLN